MSARRTHKSVGNSSKLFVSFANLNKESDETCSLEHCIMLYILWNWFPNKKYQTPSLVFFRFLITNLYLLLHTICSIHIVRAGYDSKRLLELVRDVRAVFVDVIRITKVNESTNHSARLRAWARLFPHHHAGVWEHRACACDRYATSRAWAWRTHWPTMCAPAAQFTRTRGPSSPLSSNVRPLYKSLKLSLLHC